MAISRLVLAIIEMSFCQNRAQNFDARLLVMLILSSRFLDETHIPKTYDLFQPFIFMAHEIG